MIFSLYKNVNYLGELLWCTYCVYIRTALFDDQCACVGLVGARKLVALEPLP